MTPRTFAKIAASTLVIGATTMGCSPAGQAMRPASASDGKLVKVAEKAAARANKAIAAKDFVAAIGFAEEAVASAPRDAGYRMLLGQAYLGAGRFASAETSFMDTLTLDPEHERAALNLALVEIALGKKSEALSTLADYRDKLAGSDYGLASALAGDTETAIAALEGMIRAGAADAQTRQNLALAYALAGKWTNARVMAVQDLPPAEADARIIHWINFVRPTGSYDQVASLLGVTPVQDGGQPTRLALAPAAETAVALAAPVAPVVVPVAEPAQPLVVAVATQPSAPVVDTPPAAFETASVAQPAPAPIIRPVAAPVRQVVVPASRPARTAARAPRGVESGKFVVQLGAFANVAVAHDAWKRISGRFSLTGFEPANAAAQVNGANYVRLAVGGFATRAEATHICTRVRKAGGSCFVRGAAGDQPAQWVQRGMPKRFASR